MTKNIDETNCAFYNSSGDSFDKIPFESILPDLFLKYGTGLEILEIGSGAGALALWLTNHGYDVTCLEPAQELAARAVAKGLRVRPVTIQNFQEGLQYDMIVAISSLIHVPRKELPAQIEKIANLLKPGGLFFVSFIEGECDGFEDPTMTGKLRYFCKWTEPALDQLLSPHFDLLEKQSIYNKKMDQTFLLRVYTIPADQAAAKANQSTEAAKIKKAGQSDKAAEC